MYKSGFVAVVGRTNVGKSTLINALVGTKVSIMSPKVQTTRNIIRGIASYHDGQIVFVDTPGIHKPIHKLGKNLNQMAENQMKSDVELILFVVEPDTHIGKGDQYILEKLRLSSEKNVILVINKIDTLPKNALLEVIDTYRSVYDFSEIIPISALHAENTLQLKDLIMTYLHEGPAYYPETADSDYSEKFLYAELIREKILHLTFEEVPHSIAVYVDQIEHTKNLVKIYATILVERDSQKGILIGKRGEMIQKIGTRTRHELEFTFGKKVYLDLHVKVKKNWRDKDIELYNLGYDTKSNE